VVSGIDPHGNPVIISGNHGHRVGEAVYARARVIAYVMPTDRRPATTQVAEHAAPNRSSPSSEAAFESPIAELLAAIEAEQSHAERPRQSAPQAQPPEPHRAVQQQAEEPHRAAQQMPPPAPRPQITTRDLPLDPALAELLGIKDRAPSAQARPRPRPGRVAAVDPR
jgi:hypothetical protein